MYARVKLGELCHVVTKGTTPTSIGLSFEEDGIPFLRITNIGNNTVALDNVLFISNKTHKALSRSIVKPKDFLITIAGTIGKVAIVPDNFPESNCNQAVAILRFDYEKLVPNYLLYWLSTSDAIGQITGKKVTATISNLSLGQIKELEIPLLPLTEQKRIVAILDKADSLRRKNQQAIQLADQFLRAVFLDMFGDPMTNPKGWEAIKLGHICDVGSSKRVFVNEFTDTGIPFYRGTEVGKLGESEDIQPHLFISNEHYENLKNHSGVPEIGDLLMPSICHDGRIWKVDHKAPFYFKDGRVLWIKVNQSSINSDYLICYLKYLFLTNYSSIASGTTFAELKIVNLKDVSVLTPPLDLQIKFSEITTKVIKNNDVIKFSIGKSDEMFSALSQKAFAGEL